MLCLNDKSVAKHKSACIWLDNFLCHSFKSPHTMMSIVTHKMLIVYCHLRPPPLIIWNIIYVVLSNHAEHQSRESLPPFFFVVSAFWNVCRQEFINGLTLIKTNVSDSKFIVLFFFLLFSLLHREYGQQTPEFSNEFSSTNWKLTFVMHFSCFRQHLWQKWMHKCNSDLVSIRQRWKTEVFLIMLIVSSLNVSLML